jgi:DNA-binding NarL/FixJ family response regulator
MNSKKETTGSEKAPPTILLVTTRPSQMRPFAEALCEESRMQMITAVSAEEAIDAARRAKIVLAIVDERIGETAGLDLIKHLIEIDAFMHAAVLSDADEEDFHNRSEGLGVLARLTLMPDQKDARRLYELLSTMSH